MDNFMLSAKKSSCAPFQSCHAYKFWNSKVLWFEGEGDTTMNTKKNNIHQSG